MTLVQTAVMKGHAIFTSAITAVFKDVGISTVVVAGLNNRNVRNVRHMVVGEKLDMSEKGLKTCSKEVLREPTKVLNINNINIILKSG